MTATEIAKRFDLQPKEVVAFIQAKATFYVKTDFKTGEIGVPDNIDLEAFLKPLLDEKRNAILQKEKEEEDRITVQASRDAELSILQEERERKQEELQHAVSIEKLKKTGAEGYYQYKVVSIEDWRSGYVDTDELTGKLNAMGMEGWHLVVAYSNEMGRNARSVGLGGVSSGTNSTVDQNILIFERFVKF